MMKRGKTKRGLALSVETLLLIILAIAVLTLLLVFLNSRFGIFSERVKSYSGESNVDDVIAGCNSFVVGEQYFNYCCDEKKINAEEESFYMTCDEFRQEEISSGRIDFLDCEGVVC